MVAVTSTMQALGSVAPSFELPDVTAQNEMYKLRDNVGRPLLIMFICNHCPFVVHIIDRLSAVANEAKRNGFVVMAISSNDVVSYPQDGPDPMADFARDNGFEFPYLYDQSQQVAKNYGAACTPDFFVFDAEHHLRYRGQMDDARPGNGKPVSASDLSGALQAVLSGSAVSQDQVPSLGCNIKWIEGNEPDYF